jgi:hypothetical protein
VSRCKLSQARKRMRAGPTQKAGLKKGLACSPGCPPRPQHFNGGINYRFHARAHCSIGTPIPGHKLRYLRLPTAVSYDQGSVPPTKTALSERCDGGSLPTCLSLTTSEQVNGRKSIQGNDLGIPWI